MNLTFFEKVKTLIQYSFSSILSVELLVFSILLFAILVVNMKARNKFITYSLIGIYIGLLIGAVVAYDEYVILCVKTLLKLVISYVCFPTTVAFFFTIVFITIVMIYSFLSSKLSTFKKISNYLFFSIMYFFFISFISLVAYHNIDLDSNIALYTNDYVLVIVQSSNLLLILWFVYTFFYRLYKYFQRFD